MVGIIAKALAAPDPGAVERADVRQLDGMIALAGQCLSEYDENDWRDQTWIDPDDVAYWARRPRAPEW